MTVFGKAVVEDRGETIGDLRRKITEVGADVVRPLELECDRLFVRQGEVAQETEDALQREQAARDAAGEALIRGEDPNRKAVRLATQRREDLQSDRPTIDRRIADAENERTRARAAADTGRLMVLREAHVAALREMKTNFERLTAANERVREIQVLAVEFVPSRDRREQIVPTLHLQDFSGTPTAGGRLTAWRAFVAHAGIRLDD